jgi:peroxiredoxin Q/BCP
MTNLLSIGDKAPDFTLPTDNFEDFALSNYKGKNVVLYFYPKDNTPGCTQQANEFTDHYAEFKAHNTIIVGISRDDPDTHANFKNKHNIAFPLISDIDHITISEYGAWVEKNLYGKKYMGIERSTFLINKEGKIHRIWRKVKVKGHMSEVLAEVKKLA